MAKQTFTTGQVLTAAQMTSLQQTAMLGGAASAKTASYTLVAADAGTAVSMSNASPTTITVNTALFAAGDTVQITNLGVGVCTITAGTATVNTASSLALAQYESGTLDFTSTSAAIFIKGDGAAAASGGMTLIQETVASANTSIDFSSIPGTYKDLILYWEGVYESTTSDEFTLRFNSDSGSNYILFENYYEVTSWTVNRAAVAYASQKMFGSAATSTTPANTIRGSIRIYNYASASKVKYYEHNYAFWDNGSSRNNFVTGYSYYNSTTAITSLNIVRTNGAGNLTNLSNTSIRLIGIS